MSNIDCPLDLIWGADGIAREINRTVRNTYILLSTGSIESAKRVNGRWCADRTTLRAEFRPQQRQRAWRKLQKA